MKDVFFFLGILGTCIGAAVLAFLVIDHVKARRPYLAARWDDTAGDWVNETAHDVGPDSLLLLEDLTAHLKAYAAAVADLYEPVGDERTTTNPTGDQT